MAGELPDWASYQAVLFDLDGVLTPTADIHQAAWSQMFNEYLSVHHPDQPAYTGDDYHAYVDGKPRFDGVRSFLASRGLQLPDGAAASPPDEESVGGLGNRKNQLFQQVLRDDGIRAYPGSLLLLDHLEGLGVPMAVVSSSRNAREVLAAARLADRLPDVVDGLTVAERHLAGKPAPDMYRTAAADLGVDVTRSVVVEDALSGVESGAAAPADLVIGVDRGAGPAALTAAGADLVVDDLGELVPGGVTA
ncbi:MAG: HAD family hydrolase [Desertimonas sp.]